MGRRSGQRDLSFAFSHLAEFMVGCGMAREAKSHSFLRGLSPGQLAALATIATRRQFTPGETILRQREKADRFFLIENGRAVSITSCRASAGCKFRRSGRAKRSVVVAGEALQVAIHRHHDRSRDGERFSGRRSAPVLRARPGVGLRDDGTGRQALLERLQATRHKLRVYVGRASGDENTQQVC